MKELIKRVIESKKKRSPEFKEFCYLVSELVKNREVKK